MLKSFESCELKAYQDTGGVWTIGWGHTRGVKEGMTCTQQQADAWLVQDLEVAEHDVDLMVLVGLKPWQFDALVDWTFNLGGSNLRKSTLLRKLNAGDYASVPDEMRRWNQDNGKVLQGLVRRREAEAKMWLEGGKDYGG